MIMKDYREVIQNKRKKLGWSQYKLAKEVGIAQSFMNEIEKGPEQGSPLRLSRSGPIYEIT